MAMRAMPVVLLSTKRVLDATCDHPGAEAPQGLLGMDGGEECWNRGAAG